MTILVLHVFFNVLGEVESGLGRTEVCVFNVYSVTSV